MKKGVIAARFTIRQPKLASVTVAINPATLSEPTYDIRHAVTSPSIPGVLGIVVFARSRSTTPISPMTSDPSPLCTFERRGPFTLPAAFESGDQRANDTEKITLLISGTVSHVAIRRA